MILKFTLGTFTVLGNPAGLCEMEKLYLGFSIQGLLLVKHTAF